MHRGRLQEAFLHGRQAINARRQHRLHRRGHLQTVEGFPETIGAWRPDQHPGLDQRVHALLQKKRIAFSVLDQQGRDGRKAGVVAEEAMQQFVSTRGRQRVEPQLRVVGLAAPAVLILRSVIDQQRMRAVGRLSTRLSSKAWVSASIQCRSSKTKSRGCI